ncbi:hypothetical protein POM88_013978 [Heracleum sosnowskyi]|uniref:Protein FAR1-RELATED SEQUENCE n=1 Tax=Heracleum sosnowskyi TaxID=360622 RepID=A0AAD8N3T2_9APIA|nr:hypothetical protein POM88_013978 [Heracleum sosnowskyi]
MSFLPLNRIITSEDEKQILLYKEAGLSVRQTIRVMELQKQTILFGSALLRNETTSAFKWLVKTFKSVTKRALKTIVTDQDPWMSKAIILITGVVSLFHVELDELRQGQLQNDVVATLRPTSMVTKSPLEKQVFQVFNPFAFKKFQEEFKRANMYLLARVEGTLQRANKNSEKVLLDNDLIDLESDFGDVAFGDANTNILCPPKSTTKGRPRKRRIKGGKELTKKTKTCSNCNIAGHTRPTCPDKENGNNSSHMSSKRNKSLTSELELNHIFTVKY